MIRYEAALIEDRSYAQAERVDRDYEDVHPYFRAALTFTDPEHLKTLQLLSASETTCLRRAHLLNREIRTPRSK